MGSTFIHFNQQKDSFLRLLFEIIHESLYKLTPDYMININFICLENATATKKVYQS